MRLLGVVLALAVALVLQTTLTGVVRGVVPVDLVLVVVVGAALAFGPVAGLLAGTVGGLLQDALTSGILGMGGLAQTLVGFAAATAAHAAVLMGLYSLLGLRTFPDPVPAVAIQAVGNALVGVFGVRALDAVPKIIERRRANRGMRVKR